MKADWRRFLPFARARAGGTLALVLLAAVGVALEALLPWPLKLVVDNVLAGRPLPRSVDWIAALPGASEPRGTLAWVSLGVLGVFLAVQAVQLAKSFVQADVSSRMQRELASAVFDRLQALSLAWHRRARTGDVVRRVAHDTSCLPTLITGVTIPLLASLLSLGVFFAIMWRLDPTLAVCAALVAIPMGVLIRVLGPRLASRAYEQHAAEGEVWSLAEQTLTALPVVQGFAREEAQHSRFRLVAARTAGTYLRSLSAQLQFRIGVDGIVALGVALVMLIGGIEALRGALSAGSLSVGSLIVFLSYLASLYAPLGTLAYLSSTMADAAGSAIRVAEVLDATEAVADASGAVPLEAAVAARRIASDAADVQRAVRGPLLRARCVRGHVRLEKIVFGYHPDQPVLHDVDLEVRPGELVALTGPSGAGKSTLAALIPRLYDPWRGRVTIDGVDVRAVTLASLRANVAVVLQDPFLLPVSVAENIAYGSAGASRARIEEAARLANADEFVARLSRGYDTPIGEGGATLSGGQRQRLAIARALLRDAPVLVLDEPTSALDPGTEHAVMEALERLTAGRSTLVIAHRASTVSRADRVVVIERGRIVDSTGRFASRARGGPR